MELFFGLLMLVAAIVFYFLPALIASNRGREGDGWIAVLNLLLGWTVLGWIVLLIIAFTGESGAMRAARSEELNLLRRIAASKSAASEESMR